jgi:DNA-binding transcriptional regulator YdaS (Cro superfamily)
MTPGLEKIRTNRGIAALIARELQITAQSVSDWKRVPAERVLAVEKATGIPRWELRPDLYPREDENGLDDGADRAVEGTGRT